MDSYEEWLKWREEYYFERGINIMGRDKAKPKREKKKPKKEKKPKKRK